MDTFAHFLPFEALQKISRGNGIVNHLIASRKLGGVSGDCLGAGIELVESALLLRDPKVARDLGDEGDAD